VSADEVRRWDSPPESFEAEAIDAAMSDTPRPGWWTCRICQPNIRERGGQAAFYAHWNRVHGSEAKR